MKNWNDIRGVVVYTYGKPNGNYFCSLKDAIIALYRGYYSYWNSRSFISQINNTGLLGGEYTYGRPTDTWHIYDELDLLIPHWKIVEVYNNCSDEELGCWWARKKKFKFRDGPVQGVWHRRGGYHGKGYVWQALKADYFDRFDEELKEYKFKRRHYKDRFNDFVCWERDSNYGERSWKEYRKTRWK